MTSLACTMLHGIRLGYAANIYIAPVSGALGLPFDEFMAFRLNDYIIAAGGSCPP
ncbi:MAG: hypothetical protein ACRD2N_15810 [Vicinamibacterales bacterium]